MKLLRWVYRLNASSLLVVGFLVWFLHNGKSGTEFFGLINPGWYNDHLPQWRAMGFLGELGGALVAFGFATLAIARAKDDGILRAAVPYYLLGHFFLAFMVWAKTVAFGTTPGGLLLTAVAVYPLAAYFYALFNAPSFWVDGPGSISYEERRIRDAAGQQERNRLAQDLHDSVKQQVYAIQTNLATAQARWATDVSGAREAVDRARSTAHDAMSEMVALLDRLRKDPVETVGFAEAVRRQAEALGFQSGAQIQVTLGEMPRADRLPPRALNAAFRIAQEAMANIARHARAGHVEVKAGTDVEGKTFTMSLTDDGQGFEPALATKSMGLANIRDRAADIGAWVNIQSTPGQGCSVTLGMELMDPAARRMDRHIFSVFASLVVLAPSAFLSWFWEDGRGFMLPPAIAAGAFTLYHVVAAGLLKWRAR
jgi:signal transduction histidine kinase